MGCDGWSRPSPGAGRDEAQGGRLSPAGTGAITAIFSTRHPATPHCLWRGRALQIPVQRGKNKCVNFGVPGLFCCGNGQQSRAAARMP